MSWLVRHDVTVLTKRVKLVLVIVVVAGTAPVLFLLLLNAIESRPKKGTVHKAEPIQRSFSALGISKILVRCADADSTMVVVDPSTTTIEIVGTPLGGAQGYHSPDPSWRETPPEGWGLDFVAMIYGDVLVISTKNEMQYIHHRYWLGSLILRVPENVEVIRQTRTLSGKTEPDLSAP
jgi:hypothetical protein